MGLFIKLVLAVSPAHDIARQIANAHTAFNIINTLIFLPFAAPFIKLVERLLPGSDGVISRKPIYLDVNMLNASQNGVSHRALGCEVRYVSIRVSGLTCV